MTADRVTTLEAAAFAAWPAAESDEAAGWTRRHGDGFSRRINSVTATPGAETAAVDRHLSAAAAWLDARGVSPVVRLTSASPHVIDTALAERGFSLESETLVLTRDISSSSATLPGGVDQPSAAWIDVQRRWLGLSPDVLANWRSVLGRIHRPVRFAELTAGGVVVAVGIGVVRDSKLVILEVTTDPTLRRQGHATELVGGLLAWAAAERAEEAVLQVVAANQPAVALYKKMGFREAYRYWYRRPP